MIYTHEHRLNEMASVSTPSDNLPRNTKICIYGENDEQATKEPHMHVLIDNGDIELEVKLKHIKQLEIWRTKRNYPKTWNGLANIRKAITEWLDKPFSRNKKLTNKEMLTIFWNAENPSHIIEDSFLD